MADVDEDRPPFACDLAGRVATASSDPGVVREARASRPRARARGPRGRSRAASLRRLPAERRAPGTGRSVPARGRGGRRPRRPSPFCAAVSSSSPVIRNAPSPGERDDGRAGHGELGADGGRHGIPHARVVDRREEAARLFEPQALDGQERPVAAVGGEDRVRAEGRLEAPGGEGAGRPSRPRARARSRSTSACPFGEPLARRASSRPRGCGAWGRAPPRTPRRRRRRRGRPR